MPRCQDLTCAATCLHLTEFPRTSRIAHHLAAGIHEICKSLQGNMEWMAAYEVEPATQSMYLNCWKGEPTLTWPDAEQRMRGSILNAVQVDCFPVLVLASFGLPGRCFVLMPAWGEH